MMFMRGYILAILGLLVYVSNGQIAPQWGTITCDSSLTDRFAEGVKYSLSGTSNYYRYYTFTADYPTALRRKVRISTCIEDKPNTMAAYIESHADATIRYTMNERTTAYDKDANNWGSCQGNDEQGYFYEYNDLPEGDWEIGVYNPQGSPYEGGKYKLSVECMEASIPPADQLKSNNVTQQFGNKAQWTTGGSKTISCGANAYGIISNGDNYDWYQFEITEYGQKLMFTTCTPETAYKDNWSGSGQRYDGSDISFHRLEFYYWDFNTNGNRQWRQWPVNGNYDATCTTIEIGDDAYDVSASDLLKLSPGTYYIGVRRSSSLGANSYVLSMQCWNNDAVKNAIANTNYNAATFSPTTPTPSTNPTTPTPTANTTTLSPTSTPTVTFDGVRDKIKKTMDMGEISCGIHQHDILQRKHNNYYVFELTTQTYVYFDTCMNDITQFDAVVKVYENSGNDFTEIWSSNSYCNLLLKGSLGANVYYVEISGKVKKEDFGDYILRMGCGYGEEANSVAVTETPAPTPAPTGISDIPARDGRIVGDISCGITVTGDTSSQIGDFHKFTVIGGGIDWVKFDTCDETSFENYLFVYNYNNQTGLETWQHDSYNSVGFHYEDDTTCNEIVMNDLVPGVYYVNIDGYNYYFDHGEYTIKMTCSDNSAIKGASNYEEYSTGLAWWAILLIVLACLLCCGCIIFLVCYMKKKNADGGGGGSSTTEMGKTDDAGE